MAPGSRLRTTSSPFIPGISMSMMAIWGAAAAIVATASPPSRAAATTEKPGIAATAPRSRSSAGGSSSTRTTRRTSSGGIVRPIYRDDHRNAATLARAGGKPGGAAVARLQALTDVLDTDAGTGLQARLRGAIVIDGDHQRAAREVGAQTDMHDVARCRDAVLDGV